MKSPAWPTRMIRKAGRSSALPACSRRSRSASARPWLLGPPLDGTSARLHIQSLSRHADKEGCPLPGLAFRPDPAAVTLHNPVHDRKPDARTFKVLFRVEALEHPE